MSLFLSIHYAPGLSQEEFAGYAPDVAKGEHATFVSTYVNMDEGYIVTVYEGESEEAVVSEFERIGWPVDSTKEIQFVLDKAGLDALVQSQS
ncbi:nickel-binding protein [Arthrobacter sp. SD76]|uniref:nickel-binding protein n=1 Tax=Arthrobacter sp. SD76 TaxID=3415007 RepID=UPI003C782C8A